MRKALVLATVMAASMVLSSGQAEAAKGKDGSVCSYLYSILTHPNTNVTIKAYTMSLYISYGCTTPLP